MVKKEDFAIGTQGDLRREYFLMTTSLYIECDQYNKVKLRAKLKCQLCLQAYSYLAYHHPEAPSREQLQAFFDDLKVNFPEVSFGNPCFPGTVDGAYSGV